MNRKHYIFIIIILTTLSITLSGCEKIEQVIQSETTVPILKIGVIQPGHSYTTFSQGAETARIQINNDGGVLGMPVEFIYRNNQPTEDEPTPEASIAAAIELIEIEEVFSILGPVRSTMAVEVGPVAQQSQRLMLPGSSGSQVPAVGDYIFLITVPNPFQGTVMANFAINTIAEKLELEAITAATIYETGDAYSTDLVSAFDTAFQNQRGQIVYSGSYTEGATSFNTLIADIQTAAPDVIFCPGSQPEVPLLMSEARKTGITATFLGGSAWDDRERFFSVLEDSSVLDGSYYPTNFSTVTQDTSVQEFVNGYMDLYNASPDGIAASGYDAMRLLAQAIERAGSLDPLTVRDEFAAVKNYSGATNISHYDDNRHPVKSLVIQEIQNGTVQYYKVVQP